MSRCHDKNQNLQRTISECGFSTDKHDMMKCCCQWQEPVCKIITCGPLQRWWRTPWSLCSISIIWAFISRSVKGQNVKTFILCRCLSRCWSKSTVTPGHLESDFKSLQIKSQHLGIRFRTKACELRSAHEFISDGRQTQCYLDNPVSGEQWHHTGLNCSCLLCVSDLDLQWRPAWIDAHLYDVIMSIRISHNMQKKWWRWWWCLSVTALTLQS